MSELASDPRPALNAWDITLTADQVSAQARAVAGWIREQLPEGDPVAVYARNSGQAMIASLGAVLSGASLVPLSAHLGSEELRDMLAEAGVGLVLASPSQLPALLRAVELMPDGPRVVTWGTGEDGPYGSLEAIIARARPLDEAAVRVAAPTLFSSGTTGRPKRVVMPPMLFPDGADIPHFLQWCRQRRFTGFGPHLVAGPLYHSGPQQAIWILAVGHRVFVPRAFDPAQVLDLIERERIATTLMVPTHFIRLLRERETSARHYDVSSIRQVTQTGAGCPEHVKRAMIDWWGPVFLETYGGTETGGLCFITSQEWLLRPNSVGRTRPGYRAFAVDEAGTELPAGQVGQLYFEDRTGRGIRYEGAPDLTSRAHLRPGTFTLGETGKVDSDGYVFITDRDVDKVVSGGVNIYPAEAERILATHPAVADAAAFGLPDPEMGEQLRAVVVLKDGALATPAELIGYCREKLSALKAPRSVLLTDDLGRGPMGKISRHDLRRRFGSPAELARKTTPAAPGREGPAWGR
jgi:long-chain acyl-CoA synthetase